MVDFSSILSINEQKNITVIVKRLISVR